MIMFTMFLEVMVPQLVKAVSLPQNLVFLSSLHILYRWAQSALTCCGLIHLHSWCPILHFSILLTSTFIHTPLWDGQLVVQDRLPRSPSFPARFLQQLATQISRWGGMLPAWLFSGGLQEELGQGSLGSCWDWEKALENKPASIRQRVSGGAGERGGEKECAAALLPCWWIRPQHD